MSKSTPSLLALPGLVAIAGFQNRSRISDMLTVVREKTFAPGSTPVQSGGNFNSEIGKFFHTNPFADTGLGNTTVGHTISNALSDLVDRLRDSGRGATADSWVSEKANTPIDVDGLEAALGNETLAELSHKTGLSRAELLLRLNVALPEFVNSFTPNGRLPTENEAQILA